MLYLSFVGNHDDPSRNAQGYGAFLNILSRYRTEIGRVIVFTTTSTEKADYDAIAKKNVALAKTIIPDITCDVIHLDLKNPVNFGIVYPHLLDAVSEVFERDDLEGEPKIINITSGTPTMTSCWVLLQKSGLISNARLVQSFEKQFALPNGDTTQEVNLEIDDFHQIVAPTSLKRRLTIAERRAKHFEEELQGTQLDAEVPELIGTSKAIREVKEQILKDVDSERHVLILGERGTGKGVIAEAIWRIHHKKNDDKLITFDCGTIHRDLMTAELFGYKRGAFTGAEADNEGIVRTAKNRMLFLDEVGNLPLLGQQALLRLLTHGEVRRVGSNQVDSMAIQIIAATNKNVDDATLFAPDLRDRFDEMIVIPALRDRREDIPLLLNHFLTVSAKKESLSSPIAFGAELVKKLSAYKWPGNVRELEKWVERAVRRFRNGGEISLADLPKKFIEDVLGKGEEVALIPSLPLQIPLEDYIEQIRQKARGTAQGNMSEVDRLLNQSIGTEKQRQYRENQKKRRKTHR